MTLAATGTALFVFTGGLAGAATYRGAWAGVFSVKANCDASSASRNDPPDLLTYPCEYHTSDPRSPSGGGQAGWYYFYRYRTD
ncbi:hypothetical protein [Amycolatopsis sp. NPDC004079]|uniref:Secreted protein n=1 Tax=Amycolatopsis halotolerans TaxID=330083 RepID=A0ABV7QR76_9PSEU